MKGGETTDGTQERGQLHAIEEKKRKRRTPRGTTVSRHFTSAGEDPYDFVEWETRSAKIANENGEIVFEQTDAEIPKTWSQLATNVVVSKYFRGHIGTPERESSVKQLIDRVVWQLCEWGSSSNYFRTAQDAETFSDELKHVLLTQRMAFNSPVWFNLGVADTPQQASACFINSVDDTMESIMDAREDRGDALQGWLWRWLQSF